LENKKTIRIDFYGRVCKTRESRNEFGFASSHSYKGKTSIPITKYPRDNCVEVHVTDIMTLIGFVTEADMKKIVTTRSSISLQNCTIKLYLRSFKEANIVADI